MDEVERFLNLLECLLGQARKRADIREVNDVKEAFINEFGVPPDSVSDRWAKRSYVVYDLDRADKIRELMGCSTSVYGENYELELLCEVADKEAEATTDWTKSDTEPGFYKRSGRYVFSIALYRESESGFECEF